MDINKKKCIVCKKKFNPVHKSAKICSSECRKIYYAKYRENNPHPMKIIGFTIFERDNFRCAYCGKTSYEDNVKLVIEHIFPRSKGGTNEGHNVITAC